MTPLSTIVTATVSAVLGGGGLAAIVNAFASKRKDRADAATQLSDEALKWVGEFQEEAQSARREAAELRKETIRTRQEAEETRAEVKEARARLAAVTAQAEALAREVAALRAAILDPQVTRERLRTMVRS